ncbi:MAG: PsbP-related protein [Chloroflexota bacterium]
MSRGSVAKIKLSFYPVAYAVTIFAIVVLALLILQRLAIVPLFPFQTSAAPTASPTKVLLNYSNAEHGFSLKYPQYWIGSEPEGVIAALVCPMNEHPSTDFTTNISITYGELSEESPGTLDEFMVSCEERLIGSSENYNRLSLEEKEISGLPARVLVWTRNIDEPILTRQAAFFKDKRVYVITYASLSEFDAEYSHAFDLVISTFKFQS